MTMNLYAILRRNGFESPDALNAAAARSKRVADNEMPAEVRWIRSYVLPEKDGSIGTVCIYQATGEDAIRKHAARAELAVTDVIPIADTVVIRADP
jgi:hypothetical protein